MPMNWSSVLSAPSNCTTCAATVSTRAARNKRNSLFTESAVSFAIARAALLISSADRRAGGTAVGRTGGVTGAGETLGALRVPVDSPRGFDRTAGGFSFFSCCADSPLGVFDLASASVLVDFWLGSLAGVVTRGVEAPAGFGDALSLTTVTTLSPPGGRASTSHVTFSKTRIWTPS